MKLFYPAPGSTSRLSSLLALGCAASLAVLSSPGSQAQGRGSTTLAPGKKAQSKKAPAKTAAGALATARARSGLVLGADDVIEINVSNHPDLNTTLTIRPDGRITLPRAGEVQAAGRTSQALAADIEKRLSRTLNNARVTVAIKEVHSRRVRVLGAVGTSGSYELKPNWRLMDLVAVAGGLKTRPTRVTGRIIRSRGIIPLNLEQAVRRPQSAANPLLQSNDLIVLDERDIVKQINVIGKVSKPGAYDLTEDLSVIALLNDAGGPTEQAALKKAYVQRARTQIPLDLYSLLVERRNNAPAARFAFKMGDVLVVPENEARFSITGQVTKPGFYLLPEKQEEATALQSLATAGNPLPNADLRNATIVRTLNGHATSITVDLESQRKGQAPDNTLLQPGDALFIPQRQVHVIGKVNKPGGFDISDDLSVVSLMAQAGNALPGAGLSKAYVLRNGNQIPLNLYKVLALGQPDADVTNFKFQNGDTLVIPDVQDQISVIGKVSKPGPYNLEDDLSVISLVTRAGGTLEGAALKQTYVLRKSTQIPLSLHESLIEGRVDANVTGFKFEAGDILVVPENRVRFAVLGQVKTAGYYPIPEKREDATILKALSTAGGPAPDANLRDAGIIRTVNGQPTRIPLNLEEMLRRGDNLTRNVQLQPEDILFIPSKNPSASTWSKIMGALPVIGAFF
jgi:protein involved in polysaccharide export with SLBB domain